MIGEGKHAQQVRSEYGDIAIIGIGDNATRKKIVLAQPGRAWELSGTGFGDVDHGEGSIALAGVVIGFTAKIGKHCILNHQCTVEHHATLEDFVHVAPGARVLGAAYVGEGAFIGANAVVLPEAVVPAWAIVRACSVFPCDYAMMDGVAVKYHNRSTALKKRVLKFQEPPHVD